MIDKTKIQIEVTGQGVCSVSYDHRDTGMRLSKANGAWRLFRDGKYLDNCDHARIMHDLDALRELVAPHIERMLERGWNSAGTATDLYERMKAERDELAEALNGILMWHAGIVAPGRVPGCSMLTQRLREARAALAKIKEKQNGN